MLDKTSKMILFGILVCSVIIAFKPAPSFQYTLPQSLDVSIGETVVQLGENRIAIIETNRNSGMHGEVFVLEYNEGKKTFDLIGRYNYEEFFRNPQKYNLK